MRGYLVGAEARITGQQDSQFFDVIVKSNTHLSPQDVEKRAKKFIVEKFTKVKHINVYLIEKGVPIV